jgi:hypothetical protein
MKAMKAKQVRVYLHEGELALLAKLAEITGMKDTSALSLVCSAGLRAMEHENFRVTLPLNFSVDSPQPPPSRISTLNDLPKGKR